MNKVTHMKQRKIPFKIIMQQSVVIQIGLLLGHVLPRKIGLKISSFIGTILGRNTHNPMVQAIRANQYVIHNQSLTDETLDELPKIILRSAAKCIFDYFYFISRPERLQEVISFSPMADNAFRRIKENKPNVFVSPHLSNFDLMGYALAHNDLDFQVLSFPEPGNSYKMQNQLRESLGIKVTPMNLSAFREARKRLEGGGSILTGLDRPLPDNQINKYRPTFFGQQTNLPVAYIRMALEANAPVVVVTATPQPGGKYQLEASDLIWMDSFSDLETEIIHNANRVLQEAEGFIKKYAQQWAMFYPVWPEFLGI